MIKKIISVFAVLLLSFAVLLSGCGSSGGGGSAASSNKAITAFGFASPAATGIINETAKTISVSMAMGTDVTGLCAVFTTTGVSVTVNNVAQISGVTANDFTNPVSYVVTAEDGTTATYTVTVTVSTSTLGTLISSPSTTPITVFLQTVSATGTEEEVAPGQANYWDLNADMDIDDGSDDQFDYFLQLTVGSTAFPDLTDADLTYYTPYMSAAEGVKTVSVSTGTHQWYPVLTGTYSAYIHPTSDSRLQQTLNLTSATAPVTLSWSHDAHAYSSNMGNLGIFRVVIRTASGDELNEMYSISDSGESNVFNFDISAYAGQTIVLSFEMKALWYPTVIDDVSVLDNNSTQFVTNGDFETGDLTGWTKNTPQEIQNITSKPTPSTSLEGLDVTRSFYTVPNKLWARMVDVFSNPTAAPITKTISYYNELGSDWWGIIYDTPGANGKAITSWDGGAGDRDIAFVYGLVSSVTYTSASSMGIDDGDDVIPTTYDITVPAGGKVSIVNFVLMSGTNTGETASDATAKATEMDVAAAAIVSGFWTDLQYTEGMTQDQIDSVLNF